MSLRDLGVEYEHVKQDRVDGEIDYDKLSSVMDEICELTNHYYELVPNTRITRNAIRPLYRESNINTELLAVNSLLEIEVSLKILLGATKNMAIINPMDYCFNCLNIKLMELEQGTIERDAILTYIQKSDKSILDHQI